jgi:hypothetical protein
MVKPLFFVSQGPKANVRLTGKFRDMTLGQQADSQKREFKRDRSKKRSRSQSIATFIRKLTHSGHFLSSNFFTHGGAMPLCVMPLGNEENRRGRL